MDILVERAAGITLAGTLTLPAQTTPRKTPAVVAVHSASMGTREDPLYHHLQTFLAEHGVATLVFDRRGEGASTGDPSTAAFEDLAADVQTWVQYLRGHPVIDGDRIGLWCISQGGWISALAAAGDPSITFLIAISPSGVTPAEQMNYASAYLLREAGYPEPVIQSVMMLRHELDAFHRGHLGFERARVLFEAAQSEPWFELAWLPEPTDPPGRWRLQMDFDIRPVLARVGCAVLLLFGEWDRWVPIVPSLEHWQAGLGRDADLTVARIQGAGHFPTLATERRDLDEVGPIAPEYERILRTWLQQQLVSPTAA